MNFLFQPFNDRDSNPTAYDSKMKFWKGLVSDFLKFEGQQQTIGTHSTSLSITVESVSKALSRAGRPPRCMDDVISNMVKGGSLVELNELREKLQEKVSTKRAGWSSWGYQVMISSPIRKMSVKLMAAISPAATSTSACRYILPRTLEQQSLYILDMIHKRAQSYYEGSPFALLLTKTALMTLVYPLNSEILEIVVLWLENENYVIKSEIDDIGTIYKFSEKTNAKLVDITALEIGVIKIEHMKNTLTQQVKYRHEKHDALLDEIKHHLRNKNKVAARQSLIRSKILEKAITRDMGHIQKLQSTLDEINTADNNQRILGAYEAGSKTLRALNTATQVSDIQSTMDDLTEQITVSQDISEVLSLPECEENSVADLELELENILAEDESRVKTHENNIDTLLIALENLDTASGELPVAGNKHTLTTTAIVPE